MTRTNLNMGRPGEGNHPPVRPQQPPRLTYEELRTQHDLNADGNPFSHQRELRMQRNRFQTYLPKSKALWGIIGGLVITPLALGFAQSKGKEDPGLSPHLLTPRTVAESGPSSERPVPNGDATYFTFTAGTERRVVYCQQPYVSEQGEKIANALVSPGTYDDEYWHRANVEYKGPEIGVGWTQDTYSTAGHWEVPGKPDMTMEHPNGKSCKKTMARAEVHPLVGGGTQLFLIDLDKNVNRPAPDAAIDLTQPTPGVIDQHLGPAA